MLPAAAACVLLPAATRLGRAAHLLVQVVVQVAVDLLGIAVLAQQAAQHAQASHPQDLRRQARLPRAPPLSCHTPQTAFSGVASRPAHVAQLLRRPAVLPVQGHPTHRPPACPAPKATLSTKSHLACPAACLPPMQTAYTAAAPLSLVQACLLNPNDTCCVHGATCGNRRASRAPRHQPAPHSGTSSAARCLRACSRTTLPVLRTPLPSASHLACLKLLLPHPLYLHPAVPQPAILVVGAALLIYHLPAPSLTKHR